MNSLKKTIFPTFCFLALFLLFPGISGAEENSNDNNIQVSASNKSLQTFSGEVNVKTGGGINFDGTSVDWRSAGNWSNKEQFGSAAGNNKIRVEGNKMIISYPGYGDFFSVEFDAAGNFVKGTNLKAGTKDMELNKSYGGQYGVCFGDNDACKIWNWGYLRLKTNNCGFSCDQKNKYNYTFSYEQFAKDKNAWKVLDGSAVNKCDKIHLKFALDSEWFSNLSHACSYQTDKLYTLDYTSPPTLISSCADQNACLGEAPEHSLTSTTWGKGVQRISSDFVAKAEKSLASAGVDSSAQCINGECFYTNTGVKKLTAVTPESAYFGQCRGGVLEENVEGKMTKIPEIKITTDEVKIPAVKSNVDFTVVNRPPTANVIISSSNFKVGDTIDVHCDAIDPDDCVDKISKVTMKCQDSNGSSDNCFIFDPATGILNSSLTKEISSDQQTNPYRLSAKFKITKPGSYGIVCNATDNNGTSSDNPDSGNGSGVGINGVAVGDLGGGVIDSSMKFCALLPNKGSGAAICENSSEITYNAEALYNIKAKEYKWKCGNLAGEDWKSTTEPNFKCTYSDAGTYAASLKVVDESGQETECKLQDKVKLTSEKSCQVEIRKAKTTEDFSTNALIRTGDSIEAKVKQECVGKNLPITWSTSGGSVGKTKEGVTEIKFTTGGIKSIGAKLTKTVKYVEDEIQRDEEGNPLKDANGKDIVKKVEKERKEITDCSGATVDVKDLNSWSN